MNEIRDYIEQIEKELMKKDMIMYCKRKLEINDYIDIIVKETLKECFKGTNVKTVEEALETTKAKEFVDKLKYNLIILENIF